ncbi:PREDICTED: amyotrophic lateral sclerosis 2 chromosomal region candidate gene 12 protein isoform X2 [Gavialis gangeticus]|uniref:amyotrophic lateral sclerosis 2 chromosomal region candidate gene 12 protein isoform X2 n=1 Tax=Gavialis gangeticus TaxID=94835 RepID=UPI00092E87C7|nr:PREDICTED: amyotrophic lateral sclerosis 2 chromosomal region candidate gene 12 protein isoform X2 [Gavialis gangeticus]
MSHSISSRCACWDPGNVKSKRLIKAKQGLQNLRPRSSPLGVILKDCNNLPSPVQPPNIPKKIFSTKKDGSSQRRREPPDASVEFVEISPGYKFTRSKEHLYVTLGEGFFERKRTADEPAPPITPRAPVKLETEDIVADLEEQVAQLTDMLEQQCRDHKASQKQMENEMEEKCNEIQKEHENKIRELQETHSSELAELQECYRKELRTERATAQEKLEGLEKQYKYLRNAFRMYQDSISDEMEEKWLRRQAEWKKSERTEREKALLQQKQALMKNFTKEIEEIKKLHQENSSMTDKLYQLEREKLEIDLKEKNKALEALSSALHTTQLELQNERANVLALERSIQRRISVAEEKLEISSANLAVENISLRRKLTVKNEESYTPRIQRKSQT